MSEESGIAPYKHRVECPNCGFDVVSVPFVPVYDVRYLAALLGVTERQIMYYIEKPENKHLFPRMYRKVSHRVPGGMGKSYIRVVDQEQARRIKEHFVVVQIGDKPLTGGGKPFSKNPKKERSLENV